MGEGRHGLVCGEVEGLVLIEGQRQGTDVAHHGTVDEDGNDHCAPRVG